MLILLCQLIAISVTALKTNNHITAASGVLDLSKVELSENNIYPMRGEWLFYPNRFISPTQEDEPSAHQAELIQVPADWNNHTQQSYGYASYRLKVMFSNQYPQLALLIPTVGTAYRLYINGDLIAQAGYATESAEAFQPAYAPKIILLNQSHPELDIVFHVANFSFEWGGLWQAPSIGIAQQVFNYQLIKTISSIAIAGVLFAVAIINVSHFSLRPSDTTPLLLALSCLCLCFRELDTSQVLYVAQLLTPSFDTATRINFLTFYCFIPLFFAYCQRHFPKEFQRPAAVLTYAISAVSIAIVVLTSPSFFSEYLRAFQYFALAAVTYSLIAIGLAIYRRRIGARLIGLGVILLSVFGVNDILFALDIVDTAETASLGFLAFALCQNYHGYFEFIRTGEENNDLSVVANQDMLTSLLNRRGLKLQLDKLSTRTTAGERYSLLLIDFDHFKQLNDQLGHDAGDQVLAKGASIIREQIRKQDLSARWGGEEFVVVLPNTDLRDAQHVAEKIRKKVSTSLSKTMKYSVSLSIGVAKQNADECYEACIKRADQALYQAKENGRNRVCLAQ